MPGNPRARFSVSLVVIIFMSLFLFSSSQALTGRAPAPLAAVADLTDVARAATFGPAPAALAPPDASKISVALPDADGNAAVTGLPGAVPDDAALAIVNLSARNIMTATATSDGAFSANLFAPPGSSLLVKYSERPEPITTLWQDAFNFGGDYSYMNPLPGAMLFVPGSGPVGPGTAFHAAGFFGSGDGPEWAGWWLEGEAAGPTGPLTEPVSAGATITVAGTFNGTSPALNCSNPAGITPQLHLNLRTMFGADGTPRLGSTGFDSYLFTPTGLPIDHEASSEIRSVVVVPVQNVTCVTQNSVQGDFTTSFAVPADMADGVYILEAFVFDGGIPTSLGVPQVVIWYHADWIAALPPITVGTPDPPRIPWTLFGDYLSNGHRGIGSAAMAGRYAMVTRTIYAPHQVALPPTDPRTGTAIPYRLEPGSHWLSSTDRRFPRPPLIPLALPGGSLQAIVHEPDGGTVSIGPGPIAQTSVSTPALLDGTILSEGTGHIGDIYHLFSAEPAFGHTFDQFGPHTIDLFGSVADVYGNEYPIDESYEVMIARVLDLDPAQLPTTPYQVGDAFAPGLHVYPPGPADVEISLVHMPFSDPGLAETFVVGGRANQYGYFQPPPGTDFYFTDPGEFRVDISATYVDLDGTMWAGYVTWGNVVEGSSPLIAAHGRRGMDYQSPTITFFSDWFWNANLAPEHVGIENYYPFFSGDIHWGDELADPTYKGDSIHPVITIEDLTGPAETIYDLMRAHYPQATNNYRWPPTDRTLAGLNARLAIDEAPLFITTVSGRDPTIYPGEIDMWGYWYGSSERPDVHVRELISEDGNGTAYWRFQDTYGAQIGEPADGDQPGDIKWEFGGAVFRVPGAAINEYAIYSSLWVLLPHGCDAFGCARVTQPFQGAAGGSSGGPIMTLLGQEIDMLFLPKGVRPGDILTVGDTVAFSGHVGPPLNSRVEVTITSPTGAIHAGIWQANKIGWVYDPTFDFIANETGRWTVDVFVEHDQPYIGTGTIPLSNNTGTVLGTTGQYEFYVVEPDAPPLFIVAPQPGLITWPEGGIVPIEIMGAAPSGTGAVHYTIHDKGIVMGQGVITPEPNGRFSFTYDAIALHDAFPMLSLTAHEAMREGLADEVTIRFLAVGGPHLANTVTLIGEEIFVGNNVHETMLPVVVQP